MTWDDTRNFAVIVATTIGTPGLLAMGWLIVGILKRNGYRTTYVDALLGAVGAGEEAAQSAGQSFITAEGRAAGMPAAIKYLRDTVGQTAAPALGIVTDADHALRINSRVNAIQMQVNAGAVASASAMGLSDHTL